MLRTAGGKDKKTKKKARREIATVCGRDGKRKTTFYGRPITPVLVVRKKIGLCTMISPTKSLSTAIRQVLSQIDQYKTFSLQTSPPFSNRQERVHNNQRIASSAVQQQTQEHVYNDQLVVVFAV